MGLIPEADCVKSWLLTVSFFCSNAATAAVWACGYGARGKPVSPT